MKGYPPAGDTSAPLTEVEKLQRDNYYLQMQVDVLKKLKALREMPPGENSPI
jgi:conserved domain protein